MAESSQNGYISLWQKRKLLVSSNFSFSYSFSKDMDCRHVKTRACFGKELKGLFSSLTLYHTVPTFNDPIGRKLMKTFWEKEKMLVTSIFSISQNVFYPSQNKFQFFGQVYFVVCKFFQFGPV